MDTPTVIRALIAGLVLAGAGIALFFVLYYVVFAGFAPATRLFASMLLPPVVMAVGIGAVMLLRGKNKRS